MTEALSDRLQAALGPGYRVLNELGGGGMSRVFVAEDVELERKVVVKVLPPDLAAGLNVERFRREIQLAARLQHPHIVPLLSAGARNGLLFYTMPLISGESLRARLARSGELPVSEAVRLLREVADALEYAHSQGVVHRDIKPENILLAGHHALVTDFGVSKALSNATGEQSLTSLGVALGTPAYMSPEQATADPNTDHRTDVYALGILGYELLTGRPPFTGATPQQILAAQITDQPTPVATARPTVSEAVGSVIMRCLEKRPADRWQTAADVRTQLEALGTPSQGTQPISGVSAPTPATGARLSRTKLLALGAGAAAVLLLSLFAGRYFRTGDRELPVMGAARQITNDPGIEVTPALSPDGSLIAYAAGSPFETEVFVRQVAGGQPIRIGPGRAPQWTADGSRVVFSSFAHGIVSAPALGGQPRTLVPHPEGGFVFAPALSPDGQWLAYASSDGSIYVATAEGADPRPIAHATELQLLAWSPDGSRIAYVRGNSFFVWGFDQFANIAPSTIWVAGRDGSNPVRITDENTLNVSPAWTSDGHGILYVSNAGGGRDVYYQRLGRDAKPAGAPQRLTTGLSLHGISLSRDGRYLAYSNLVTSVGIWRLPVPAAGSASVSEAQQITSASERIEAVAVSADGQWLAFDSDRGGSMDIYRMRPDGSGLEQLTRDPADAFRPVWSPDGSEIAFHSFRNGARTSYVMRADGSGQRVIAGGPQHNWAGRFSPDGRWLAYQGQTGEGRGPLAAQIFVVPREGGEPRQITNHPGAFGPAWTPDGQVAYLTWREGLNIVPPDGGTARPLSMPGQADHYFPLEIGGWSSDRRALYVRVGSDSEQGLHIARVPLDGSPGSIVVRFDQPDRQSLRPEFSTDGRTFYFTIGRHEADIWVVELHQRSP